MSADKLVSTWMDDFIVELRLRDVRGAAIGDAVRAVESHLAESGESPAGAFGDPRAYAASLQFRPEQYDTSGAAGWTAAFAPVVCGLLGLTLTTSAVRAVRLGDGVDVTWGSLAALAFLALVTLALRVGLRWLLDHIALGIACMVGVVVVMTALTVTLDAAAFQLPVWGAAGLAIILLALSVVLQKAAGRVLADPITDPLDRSDMLTEESPALTVFMEKVQPWVFVIASAALGVLTWFGTP